MEPETITTDRRMKRKTLPPNTVVFKPTPKAIKNGSMTENMRLVFNGDGTVAMWEGDQFIQGDVIYDRPDSHCTETAEQVPELLYAHPEEIRRTEIYGMKLPFRLLRRA